MKRAPEKFFRKCWRRVGDCNHTKYNLNNIFHEGKGEWAFFVFSEGKIIAIIKIHFS
jgi:hypothetical protein